MQPEMHFPSKRDGWIVAVIWGGAAAMAVAVVSVAREPGVPLATLGAVALLGFGGASFLLWTLYGTGYTLGSEELRIRAGPFRWRVTLAEIRSVVPTHNPLSSPACSLDRLRIEYGARRQVMISPEDKAGFLAGVAARAAQLELCGDRALPKGAA